MLIVPYPIVITNNRCSRRTTILFARCNYFCVLWEMGWEDGEDGKKRSHVMWFVAFLKLAGESGTASSRLRASVTTPHVASHDYDVACRAAASWSHPRIVVGHHDAGARDRLSSLALPCLRVRTLRIKGFQQGRLYGRVPTGTCTH